MSGNVRGLFAGNVVIEDDGGTGMVSATEVVVLRWHAMGSPRKRATRWGRSWSLADLIEADDLLTCGELAELPPCVHCIDGPATTTNLRDQPVCSFHAPDDNPEDDR